MMKKSLKYLIFTAIILFFSSCSNLDIFKPILPKVKIEEFLDQVEYNNSAFKDSKKLLNEFNRHYFRVWNQRSFLGSKKSASYMFKMLKYSDFYAQNRLKWQSFELKKLINNANFDSFDQVKKYAITVKNSYLKLFPTIYPLFKDFKRAGEGYPFDYNQNSQVWLHTPLYVSHFSKDKEWVFVQTSYASGWIPYDDIAFVDKDFIDRFKSYKFIVALSDNFAIYDKKRNFLKKVKLSTLFPLKKEYFDTYKIFVVRRDHNANAYFYLTKVNKKNFSLFPAKFQKSLLFKVVTALMDEKYGWGGYLNQRDCSTLTRDLYATFGIWLPRNSKYQSIFLPKKNLTGLDRSKKERYIIKYGKPFLSLLYLKGHIMVYIGHKNNQVYVLHNLWGIRTKKNNKEGRYIIGKAVISTLYLGEDLPNIDKSSLLIDRIIALNSVISKKYKQY